MFDFELESKRSAQRSSGKAESGRRIGVEISRKEEWKGARADSDAGRSKSCCFGGGARGLYTVGPLKGLTGCILSDGSPNASPYVRGVELDRQPDPDLQGSGPPC